jgi:NodT family efflux transporter outer membrane factor (OMF) lipoprotein
MRRGLSVPGAVSVLGVFTALAAAGCAKAPPTTTPDLGVVVPQTWTAADSPAGQIQAEWWTDFGDPSLDGVVRLALEQNRDLQAAAARLEQAAADSRIAGADLQPSVQASFTQSRRKQNFIGFPIPGSEDRVLSTISVNMGVSLETSWEVDLWGRLRAGARASLADLQATAADYRGAQLSLSGQVAKAWLAAVEARQQVALAETTVNSFRASSVQVRARFEQGLRPSLDLRLSLANLANAQALLQQRRQQLDATRRQLNVLISRYAGEAVEIPAVLPDVPAPIPAGLPADLVGRRPDLVSAERRLASATERLTVARRDLYPRLSLTASGGTASGALRDLVDPGLSVWSLASSLLQPVLQGGRLRAGVDRAEARIEESLASYTSTALQAYAEVESALAADEFLAERSGYLGVAAEQSRAAEQLANDRYRAGLEDFVTVLESQRQALQAEGELIAARRLHLDNRVDLYLALGGGFHQLEAPIELELDHPAAQLPQQTAELQQ